MFETDAANPTILLIALIAFSALMDGSDPKFDGKPKRRLLHIFGRVLFFYALSAFFIEAVILRFQT